MEQKTGEGAGPGGEREGVQSDWSYWTEWGGHRYHWNPFLPRSALLRNSDL